MVLLTRARVPPSQVTHRGAVRLPGTWPYIASRLPYAKSGGTKRDLRDLAKVNVSDTS